jgi:hypothetical protein
MKDNSVYLSRAQAQLEFVKGNKVAHIYFQEGGYVKLDENKNMVDESGNILNKQDFWINRGGAKFDLGWIIIY